MKRRHKSVIAYLTKFVGNNRAESLLLRYFIRLIHFCFIHQHLEALPRFLKEMNDMPMGSYQLRKKFWHNYFSKLYLAKMEGVALHFSKEIEVLENIGADEMRKQMEGLARRLKVEIL